MNDFRIWLESQGYNQKQIAKAGETIGLSDQVASLTNRGLRELTTTDRLAMAAVAAGLPPWSPNQQGSIEAYARIIAAFQDALNSRLAGQGAPETSVGQTLSA